VTRPVISDALAVLALTAAVLITALDESSTLTLGLSVGAFVLFMAGRAAARITRGTRCR
jgi:hypothetical protein